MTGKAEYLVPSGRAQAHLRVRGSRFIASASTAERSEEALAARDSERRHFHDATHYVFAFRPRDGAPRFDDDGEPTGTGGRPVLGAIDRAGIHDVVVVVTRYFGGVKLGPGGLGRAYGKAAALALVELPRRRVVRAKQIRITYRYEDTGAIARVLEALGAVRLDHRHGARAEVEIAVELERASRLAEQIRDITGGRASVADMPGEMLLPGHT